ncbi:MAG TPA: hypothetical protein VHA12_01720 [Candidatus Nanoarchaeia archaeon]|nr:hypothetical protein [Candidatus Nanoarchaeia archaeon]
MPSESTKERIAKSLCFELKNLVNTHQYPISREVCIHAFKEGLHSTTGADVELDDRSQTMSITMGLVDGMSYDSYTFSTVLRFDEVLKGEEKFPGSIRALNRASYRLFDEIRYGMPRNYNGARWNFLINGLNRDSVTRMGQIVDEEVEKRRDAILLNRFLHETPTYTSDLIWEVLGRYNLDAYERALYLHSSDNPNPCHSPLPHQLLTRDWNNFTEHEWPSPRCIERFLWGSYLYEIAQIKGYDYETRESLVREYLIKHGSDELTVGDKMQWGEAAFSS